MSFIKYKQRSFARFQLLLRELGSLVMERILPSADEETALTTRVGRARLNPTSRRGASRRRPKTIEPQREPVSIRVVLSPLRKAQQSAVQPFDRLQHRPILLSEQTLRDVQSVVWIDSDQVGVEGGMMDFRKRDAVANHRLTKQFVLILDDVSSVE